MRAAEERRDTGYQRGSRGSGNVFSAAGYPQFPQVYPHMPGGYTEPSLQPLAPSRDL